ncbi:MAG TPA: sugar transferase [Ignavibacteriaceae bacterium]|nr:sugar transferase [Ignavibacteriaceae bacterium]
MGKQGSFLKRATDIILSLILLIISSPLLLLFAILIKFESRGPVFFIHERTGYLGKPFRMIKFRGMIDNALEYGPVLTQENDSRITKVGKIMRRTSIDEIPQVINILKGEMSMIGPRPEMVAITENYNEKQREIFKIKPGLTGISQVNGRQKLTPEQRVQMEMEYYRQETFLKDLKIFIKTFAVIVSNEGNI